ncbi:hypothetical protein DU504_17260 [Haloplanus salinus]|uniref:Uncharacterized protein n=1 Tax=Haloplanus salinus TaxID=1126245 RepID=A0A368N4I4_9EURY|nr:hypothetical protein DU504_17260 [Haloplanus salinus]
MQRRSERTNDPLSSRARWHILISHHDGQLIRSERKPTTSGVRVSNSIAQQSTRYCSSGYSTASNPASIIS